VRDEEDTKHPTKLEDWLKRIGKVFNLPRFHPS